MEDTLIEYNTAVLAKEKGFKENCNAWYFIDGDIYKESCSHEQFGIGGFLAPTQSLLAKWLRDKHNIHVDVGWRPTNSDYNKENPSPVVWWHMVSGQIGNADATLEDTGSFNTYEQAYEKGLQEALKLIK